MASSVSSHIPSVVFGKESQKSSRKDRHRNSYVRPLQQVSSVHDNPEWTKSMRIQVQVDQGKKAISELCLEMSSFLPAEDTHISEDEELIDYILRAVRICRMLMHENNDVNLAKIAALEKVAGIEAECERKLKERDEIVAYVTAERERMRLEHYGNTRELHEEIKQLRAEREKLIESVHIAEGQNMATQRKLDAVETKLLEIPRCEEQILKRAKNDIKLKEISLNKRECKWKRLEAQVGDIQIWKEKAQQLETTVLVQRRQIEERDKQSRKALRLYQRAISTTASQFRTLAIQTGATISPDTSPAASPTRPPRGGGGQSSKEEPTAAALLTARMTATARARPQSASAVAGGSVSRQLSTGTAGASSVPPDSARQSLEAAANKEKDMHIALIEAKLIKANAQNDYLEKKVKALAKSLAQARATPLLALSDKVPVRKSVSSSSSRHHHPHSHGHAHDDFDDAFASFIDQASRRSPDRLNHPTTGTGSGNDDDMDDDDDRGTSDEDERGRRRGRGEGPSAGAGNTSNANEVDDIYQVHDTRTMEQIRRENSKNLTQVMMAMGGASRTQRITFDPALDDGSENWLDPNYQLEEEKRKQQRLDRKNSMAADLRSRISHNRANRVGIIK